MSHTCARIHIHLIFSTKERQKLTPKAVQPQLWSYMAGIFHNKGISAQHICSPCHLSVLSTAALANLWKAVGARL